MNATGRALIMQRWNTIQHDLMPELKRECGGLTPKLEKLVYILDWVRIEKWSVQTWQGIGRKPHDRSALANAFVAKAVLGLSTTRALIDRLAVDRALKRLCGFSMWKLVPDEATFSRAFAELAKSKLAERVQEALMKNEHQSPDLRNYVIISSVNWSEKWYAANYLIKRRAGSMS